MPPKLQGAVVLGLGVIVLLGGSIGSIALLSGAATGSNYHHVLTGFGLALSIVGWVGFKELRKDFNAIPWSGAILFLSLVALGIFARI